MIVMSDSTIFPTSLRVTLWITTAIHLETPKLKMRPETRPDVTLAPAHRPATLQPERSNRAHTGNPSVSLPG
jgi:hypothetical protein